MNKAIQKKSPMKTIRELIVSQKDQIAMALPKHMTPDRLIRVSMTALRRNADLMQCTQGSLLGSIISAAQLGLETDGALGHAYLVPFKTECQLIIGYRGMIDLARRSGQIVSISARVVYENDEFKYSYGLEEVLEHVPAMRDRGAPIAAYAVARLKGGGYQFEVLSLEQIKDSENASKSRRADRPWATHWDEMARKTAVRRLFKYLPVSVEIQKAVGLDDMAEAGVSQGLDSMVIDIEPEDPKSPLNQLTDKLSKDDDPETAKEAPKSKPFEPLLELQLAARDKYGSKSIEWIEHNGKCKMDDLTPEIAGTLLDKLNEEASND